MALNAQLGMVGLIAITGDGTPTVDRELTLFVHELYASQVPSPGQDFPLFDAAAYLGNTPTLRAEVGERVRLRLGALGTDFHVFHVHGHRWLRNGEWTDTLVLGPSTAATIGWAEDEPGECSATAMSPAT